MAMEVDSTGPVDEMEADIAEVRAMLQQVTRTNVRKEFQLVLDKLEAELALLKTRAIAAAPPIIASAVPSTPMVVKTGPWTEITTFALDLGGYSKPHVTVDFRLKGVEFLPPENVTCDFTEASFDLKVLGLDGQDFRFVRTNLEKDIVPAESGVKVKKNHVIITLQKVKGEYGYDSWVDLVAKGRRKPTTKKDLSDPGASIMDMMKDLYEDGDENMKKIIGEAMYKARSGEKFDPKDDNKTSFDDKMLDMDSEL